MFDFHEKRRIRGLLFSKVTIGIILILAGLLSFNVFERYAVEREMAEKREAKEEELRLLQQRAATLEAKVQHLQDRRGIEEELRSRFDVAKEGEEVVVIVDDEEEETDLEALAVPPGPTSTPSFFERLKFW